MKKQLQHEDIKEKNNHKSGLPKLSNAKILTLILCLTLLFAALIFVTVTVCGNGDDPDPPSNGENAENGGNGGNGEESGNGDTVWQSGNNGDEPDEPEPPPVPIPDWDVFTNLEAAMTAFNRDDVMFSAGDIYVTWADLYVFIFGAVQGLTGDFSQPINWSDTTDGVTTLAELVMEMATENALNYLLFRHGAETLNVSLTQEDISDFNEFINSLLEQFGGHDEFSTALREEFGFYDFETFETMLKSDFLITTIISSVLDDRYGEDASGFPDEAAAAFAAQEGYMMAKHILVSFDLDDPESIPIARAAAEELYNELRARVGDADFETFFTEMMFEHSEDPGLFTDPEGYLFQAHDMVLPFSEATMQLVYGEMSDIVESQFGFHIILRLPINYDVVPLAVSIQGQSFSLRQLAANDSFEDILDGWRDNLDIVFSPLYYAIDIARMFAWLEVTE